MCLCNCVVFVFLNSAKVVALRMHVTIIAIIKHMIAMHLRQYIHNAHTAQIFKDHPHLPLQLQHRQTVLYNKVWKSERVYLGLGMVCLILVVVFGIKLCGLFKII